MKCAIIFLFFLNAEHSFAQLNDSLFEKHFFPSRDTIVLPYRLLKPSQVKLSSGEKEKKFPLVLYLHGAGERGNDASDLVLKNGARLFASVPMREKFPCYVVVPQCPKDVKWSNYKKETGVYVLSDSPPPLQNALFELVQYLKKTYPIDESRVYVVGLSMGGFGTWELIMRFPTLFSAAVPICGGGDITRAALIKHIPIWVFHGAKDNIINVEWSRSMVSALKAVGSPVIYSEYSDVEHGVWNNAFETEELFEWMFQQKKSF